MKNGTIRNPFNDDSTEADLKDKSKSTFQSMKSKTLADSYSQ